MLVRESETTRRVRGRMPDVREMDTRALAHCWPRAVAGPRLARPAIQARANVGCLMSDWRQHRRIGQRLRALREAIGLSQRQAGRVGRARKRAADRGVA